MKVEQRLPRTRQPKPAGPSGYVRLARPERPAPRYRCLEAPLHRGSGRTPVKGRRSRARRSRSRPLSDRIALLRAPRSSTNEGRDPNSRWYIRGVLHSHPVSIYIGALATLTLMVMVPASVLSTALLFLSGEMPEQLRLGAAAGFSRSRWRCPCAASFYLIWGLGGSCRICGQKLFRPPLAPEELEGAPRPRPRLYLAALFSNPHFPLVPLHPLRHSGAPERIRCGVHWKLICPADRAGPCVVCLASCAKLGLGGKSGPPRMASPFGHTGIPPQLRARAAGTPARRSSPAEMPPHLPAEFISRPRRTSFSPIRTIRRPAFQSFPTSFPKRRKNTVRGRRAKPSPKNAPPARASRCSSGSPTPPAARCARHSRRNCFPHPDFERWASENLIRLRVDANVTVDDPDLSLEERRPRLVDLKNYVDRLKKQYKVLGHPSLILLNPSGEVIGRYRGYKRGQADYTWGLHQAGRGRLRPRLPEMAGGAWKRKATANGMTAGAAGCLRNSRTTPMATLTLIEPDGTRSRTSENKLSDDDRAWIEQQKKIRGLR